MTVELTPEELKFIRACADDSASEGHFDHRFEEIDIEKVIENLVAKGILDEVDLAANLSRLRKERV